jgi:hypothetical protein
MLVENIQLQNLPTAKSLLTPTLRQDFGKLVFLSKI